MPRSTKTVTTEPQPVDVDNDGDIDAIVSHSTTITIEDEECPPGPTPNPEPGADGGACGETACWSRTALTFTDAVDEWTYTFTPPWPGNIAWDFGDGSAVVVGRGPVSHTYSAEGPVTVKASPIASACLKSGSRTITVVDPEGAP